MNNHANSSNCDPVGGRKRSGDDSEGGEQTNAWKRQAQSVVGGHDNHHHLEQPTSQVHQPFGSTNKGGSLGTGFPSDRARALASIQVQEVVRYPLPGCEQPTDFSFSPGGSVLCTLYSRGGTLQKALHVCKIRADGPADAGDLPLADFEVMAEPPRGSGVDEQHLSLEEKLRRERLRERGLGITRYFWSKAAAPSSPAPEGSIASPFVMVPLPDGVYLKPVTLRGRAASGGTWDSLSELQRVIPATTERPVLEPTISPDGRKISYVCNGDLYCYFVAEGQTRRLTQDAEKGLVNGLAEYVAQEEMDRRTGHWWSPCSTKLAFAQYDVRHIPSYRIRHHLGAAGGAGAEEEHEYPFVGKENARVRVGVVPVESPEGRVWTDISAGGRDGGGTWEEYVPRVGWFPDGRLYAQLQDRRQQTLQLVQFDAETGKRKTLVEEKTSVWHNLNNCFRPLSKYVAGDGTSLRGGFLWASERDGYRHLYLYTRDGTCLGQVTSGDWMVDSLDGIDESQGLLYFSGTVDSEIERHLYCASLSNCEGGGRKVRRVTKEPGMHHVILDPSFRHFVDIHDSPSQPPQITFCSLSDGEPVCMIHKGVVPTADDRLQRLGATPPELVTVKSQDGATLHGAIYRPDPEVYGPGPYKTLVSVYGGPHVQTVSRSWILTVDMRAQLFRAKGYLVFKLDNRGSSRRGLRFEGAVQHRMGGVEIEDQVCGVRWLEERKLADPDRVGIYGWSYGGYMSAMALAKAPEVFKAAVAGAPVTAWDGYDTHYTERYMGLLEENKHEYESSSSVIFNAPRIRGRLFLIHGMIDENVHLRHTVRLIKALNTASIEYDLLLFPSERHMPRALPDRIYMEKRIAAFFEKNL